MTSNGSSTLSSPATLHMSRHCTTRMSLGSNPYPCILVLWTEDDDSNGWTGKAQFWPDGDTKESPEHQIHLRQGQPLGSIFVDVDEVAGAGCWAMGRFDGSGLTERDLQWATLFAREALLRKRALLK